MEKTREHNCLLLTLLINLIPRIALWQVLEKYGVPLALLSIVHSFHEGMRASDSFKVRNGVQQGCTIASACAFNL